MEKSSPLIKPLPEQLIGQHSTDLRPSSRIVRPLPAKEFIGEAADPLVQEQWIQPALFLTIVSPSRLLREALVQLLRGWSSRLSYSLVGGDPDPDDASDLEVDPHPGPAARHLVLLDHGMGRATTLAYLQRWRTRQAASCLAAPEMIVLELSNDSDTILDCIAAGAQGYILQGAATGEIVQVIEQILRGRARCSPEITAKLFKRLAEATVSPPKAKPLLTQRELEVLHSIARGCSDRDIATELVIEVRTVKHHVHNLLRKLEVKCRWQAAQLAIDNRWVNLADCRDRA